MSRVKTSSVDWANQDYPGYVIVHVGDGYEVHRGGKRIGHKADNWDAALELVEDDMERLALERQSGPESDSPAMFVSGLVTGARLA